MLETRSRADAHFRVAIDTLATLGHAAASVLQNPQLDSLSGQLVVSGDMQGSLRRFTLNGSATGTQLAGFGVHAGHLQTSFSWTGAPNLATPITATMHADSVSAHGQLLDTIDAHGSFHRPTADLALRVRRGAHQTLALAATVQLNPSDIEIHYDSVVAVIDSAGVHSTEPGIVRWSSQGLGLQHVRLQSFPELGRLTIDGSIPIGAPASAPMLVELTLDSVSAATVRSFLGSAPIGRGTMALHASVAGTAGAPAMTGTVDLAGCCGERSTASRCQRALPIRHTNAQRARRAAS